MGTSASSLSDAGCSLSELNALKEAKKWHDSCGRVYLLKYARENGAIMIKGVSDTLSFDEMLKEDNVDVMVDFKEKTLAFREVPIIMKKKVAPPPISKELLKELDKAVEDMPEQAAEVLLNVLKALVLEVGADGSLRVLAMKFETSFDGEFVRAKIDGLCTVRASELRALKKSGVHGTRSMIDMGGDGCLRIEKSVDPPKKKRKRDDV